MPVNTTLPALLGTGVHASRPAATGIGPGGLYACTTHNLIYQTNGTVWSTWATIGGGGGGGGAHPDLATHDSLGLATDAELAAHEAAADPHAGYVTNGELTAHGAAADPHPVYTTADELTTAVTAHEAAADPHAAYVIDPTSTQGDMLYLSGADNVALSKTATASSTGDGCTPDLAVNGVSTGAESPLNSYNGTTPRIGWRSNGNAAGEWLRVDLGSALSVERVIATFGQMGSRKFQSHSLQWSPDGSAWTTVYTRSTYVALEDRTFTPVSARYWRVLCGATDGYGGDIIELQLVSASALARTPSTTYGRAALNSAAALQSTSEKGANNGYAGLGSTGKVPIAQLASGTPTGSLFIRDDGTLAAPAGGGGGGSGAGEVLLLDHAYGADDAGLAIGGGAWVDLSVNETFTKLSPASAIRLMASVSSQFHDTSSGDNFAGIRLLIDSGGTPIAIPVATFILTTPASADYWSLAGSVTRLLTGLAAGAHTIKWQARSNAATADIYLRPVANATFEYATAQVSELGAGTGDLLGIGYHAPSTQANYSTSSTTLVDIDATNCAVTFVAPAGGAVLVYLQATLYSSSNWGELGIREGTTQVGDRVRVTANNAGSGSGGGRIRVSGLTPGTSYTWKLGYTANNSGGTLNAYAGTVTGPLIIEVRNAAPGGGSAVAAGGLVLLEQHTAASSASLDFTSFISSTYDEYLFEILDLQPVTNSVQLLMRVRSAGAFVGAAKYQTGGWAWIYNSQAAFGNAVSSLTNQFTTSNANDYWNGVSAGANGWVRLYTPQSASAYKRIVYDLGWQESSTGMMKGSTGRGMFVDSAAIDGFQFLYSSGNINAGTVRVYGVAKT